MVMRSHDSETGNLSNRKTDLKQIISAFGATMNLMVTGLHEIFLLNTNRRRTHITNYIVEFYNAAKNNSKITKMTIASDTEEQILEVVTRTTSQQYIERDYNNAVDVLTTNITNKYLDNYVDLDKIYIAANEEIATQLGMSYRIIIKEPAPKEANHETATNDKA